MDCETDVYQNGYCSVYPYFLFIKIRVRALNMEIQLVALNLQHVCGRCSSLSSVLSAFGCAVWLCWCGTFYCVIFFHKECGGVWWALNFISSQLCEWLVPDFCSLHLTAFTDHFYDCTEICYWWILYNKTSDIL